MGTLSLGLTQLFSSLLGFHGVHVSGNNFLLDMII